MVPVAITAHAKLNLRLELVGRRADGYHLLRMINVTLGLADALEISEVDRDQGSVIQLNSRGVGCSAESAAAIMDPTRSTFAKAVSAFNAEFQTAFTPFVRVDKRIPAQAGLGGGSADAAAMLRWCQAELEAKRGIAFSACEMERLFTRALALGADVPYALTGGCALVEGVGELITPLSWSLRGTPILLVIPSEGVSTPAAFAGVRSRYPTLPEDMSQRGELPVLRSPRELVHNDLFSIVSSLVPVVADTAAMVNELISEHTGKIPGGSGGLGMTGSGSTLFLLPEQWGPAAGWHEALSEIFAHHAPSLTTIATTIL